MGNNNFFDLYTKPATDGVYNSEMQTAIKSLNQDLAQIILSAPAQDVWPHRRCQFQADERKFSP